MEASELRVDEAPLTGESVPVEKSAAAAAGDAPLPERSGMLFKGTTVVAGSARAVVAGTGMATELGRIGGLVAGIPDERTPLERRLDALGRRLVWIALGAGAAVAALGVLQGAALAQVVETGIALAIAAVPEGLPAVATIALAVGVRRMARRHALVRRLPSVETLGSVTVICTDKTGTLTAGEMTVTVLVAGGREIAVTGTGYEPTAASRRTAATSRSTRIRSCTTLLRAGALANRAQLWSRTRGRAGPCKATRPRARCSWRPARPGLSRASLLDAAPLEGELPFSSERLLMATFHRTGTGGRRSAGEGRAATHPRALQYRADTPGEDRPLDDARRAARCSQCNDRLAARALRVLALAGGPVAGARRGRPARPRLLRPRRHDRPAGAGRARHHPALSRRRHPHGDDHRRPAADGAGDRARPRHRTTGRRDDRRP